MKHLSNLPPGVTDYDIEDQAGAFESDYPDIQDDDYKISDYRNGYYVSGPIDREFSDFDEAIKVICLEMNRTQWFPDVWFINDHGNVDLLSINADTQEYEISKSWA